MTVLKEIITNSPNETEKVGFELAEMLRNNPSLPPFIALYGDLGVGKTAFVRGFARVFSPNALVRSPTFALVNDYTKRGGTPIYHFDVYRITDDDDLYSTGFYDYLRDKRAFCLVEWSENIRYAFPKEYFAVRIEKCDTENVEKRLITIFYEGKK